MKQGGGDVGAVGKADGGQAGGVEGVVVAGGDEEIGEAVGAADDFGGVEDALGEAGATPLTLP